MHMHKSKDLDCLTAIITAQEAAQLWGLSRNAVSDACRRGALRATDPVRGPQMLPVLGGEVKEREELRPWRT